MVLSDNGDHPMTKLSDTQAVILSAASQRDDGAVLPLPETLKIKGGALNKVMDSLRNRGLIRVLSGDGGPERVVITSEGMAAIGVEADDNEALASDSALTSAEADSAADAPAPASEADGPQKRAKTKAAKGRRRPPRPHRPRARPRPRLRRPTSPRRAPAPSRR